MLRAFLINRVPISPCKAFIGRLLYRSVVPFFGRAPRLIRRNGILFEVDLSEGIDLQLFVLGNFQRHVSRCEFLGLPPDAVVLDVGANVGVMALHFASAVPRGHVYAFEPTQYGLGKLRRNLSLNPDLAARMTVVNAFVAARSEPHPCITAYASWKVDGDRSGSLHPVHQGTARAAEGVPAVTLDDFCRDRALPRLDFVKIDTDGNEPGVLEGARSAIARFRPKVIFEIGQYVMAEKGIDFSFYTRYFGELSYRLQDSKSGAAITLENHRRHVPALGTIDILAVPA